MRSLSPSGSSLNGLVFATRTVVVSLIVGILVTLLASLRPAIRATRVPPIAAVREGSVLPTSRFERYGAHAAFLVGGAGVAGLLVGAFVSSGLSGTTRLLLIRIGVLLLFLGMSIESAPRIVKPIARVASRYATLSVTFLSILVFPLTFVRWVIARYVSGAIVSSRSLARPHRQPTGDAQCPPQPGAHRLRSCGADRPCGS